MTTEKPSDSCQACSTLIQALQIEHAAMIEVAGTSRQQQMALYYYDLAKARAGYATELEVALTDSLAPVDERSTEREPVRFLTHFQELVIALRDTLSEESSYAALGATVRIEDAILDQYKRAIYHGSESPWLELLRRHHDEIGLARQELANLRDKDAPLKRSVPTTLFDYLNSLGHQATQSESPG